MSRREIAWYENPDLKGLFIKAASNAMRGYHCAINLPKTTFVGTNSLIDLCNHLSAYLRPDEKRVLLVVDKDLRKYAEKVAEMLSKLKQIDSKIFDNVLPDVPRFTVVEAVEVCNEYDPKVIISIGGGSAIDTSKLILLFYERPNINLNNMVAPSYVGLRKKVRLLVAIPTTSGTGSETTFIAVITDTNRDPPKKTEVILYEFVPDIAILYPDFVKSMPPSLTMGTGMDAMAHALGSYLLTMSTDFTDMANLKAIDMILKYLPRAVKRGNDMEAREKMQMASFIAGVGFGNISGGVEHSLGHAFGAIFHTHHGMDVSIYLPGAIAYLSKVTDRIYDIAKIWDIETKNREKHEIVKDQILALQEFQRKIGCPLSVQEIEKPNKISREDYMAKLEQMTDFAFNDYCTLSSTRKLDPLQIRKILEIAYENKIVDLMQLYYM